MTDEVVDAEVVEEARNLPAVQQGEAIMARAELSVDEVVKQKDKIKDVMERVMTKDIHYGVIPGTPKPTLLKPGAEAIISALRLAPDYQTEKHFDGDHLTVFSKCLLSHITSGLFIAAGDGMCSSKEKKYAVRKAMRVCPDCGEPQLRRSKFTERDAPPGSEPGWYCWKKEGGCGANHFAADDTRITSQAEGEIVNPDLPDTWNTVLKMADKRALVAAVLNGTAASDVFTQDVEDSQTAREEAKREGRREEGAQPFPVPTSWPKLEVAVKQIDNPDEAWGLWEAFLRAATYHAFGTESLKELKAADRAVMFQRAAGAVVWLQENVQSEGPGFRFFDESAMRQAWAAILGGVALEIPDYVPEPPGAEDVDEEAERLARETFAEDMVPRVPQD
jgi:hypothetical protein